MKIIRSLIGIALLCAAGWTHAAEFSGKVIAVLDGDTIMVMQDKKPVKVRMAEIDAPEVGHAGMGGKPPNSQKAQPFGETSKRSLSDMVLGKQVKVTSQATDQYGRMVAHLSVDGLDVNAEQIRRGMAWEYSHFHSNKALIALQHDAMQAPRGLWALSDPTPPWEWRKLHPNVPRTPPGAVVPSVVTAAALDASCDKKKQCSQMASCEEARDYLARCGTRTLDGDGDGMPCESLCAPKVGR